MCALLKAPIQISKRGHLHLWVDHDSDGTFDVCALGRHEADENVLRAEEDVVQ